MMLDRQEVPAVIKCAASAQLELDDPAEAAVMNVEVIIKSVTDEAAGEVLAPPDKHPFILC